MNILNAKDMFPSYWPWVPTSEYLPECDVYVLFLLAVDISFPERVKLGKFFNTFVDNTDFYEISQVVLWTYVPDPYRFSLPRIYKRTEIV